MSRLTIFVLLAVTFTARAQDQDSWGGMYDYFSRTYVSLRNRNGEQVVMVGFNVPVVGWKNFKFNLVSHNYAVSPMKGSSTLMWSECSYRHGKIMINYRVLHNFPNEWRQVEARRFSEILSGYQLSTKVQAFIMLQRFGTQNSAKFFINWRLPTKKALYLDFGTYSALSMESGKPAFYAKLKIDIWKFNFINLTGSLSKHSRQLNKFFIRSAEQVKRETCPLELKPEHDFISF